MKKILPRNPELRGAVGALALVATTLLPVHAADFTEWKSRQPLNVTQAGIVTVALPAETLDAARADRGDLRLLDPAGQEVSFVVQQSTRPAVETAAARSFRSTLNETSTQLVIECGATAVSEIVLETPARDFLKRARIETSADGIGWATAEDGVPLFRQSGAERLAVQVNAPFVRITLDDTRSRPVPFTGAKITPASAAPAAVVPLPARIARREEFAGETVLTLDLSAAHVPLDSLVLSTPERLFTRRVTVGVRELRDESAAERSVTSGTIYNIALDDSSPAARLTVPLNFTAPSRELIVHIANDDSRPLAITGVELTRFETTLLFNAAVPGAYAVLTGHPQIAAPRYDVAQLRLRNLAGTARLTPGPLTANPGYKPAETLAGTPLLGATLDPAPWIFRKAVQLASAGVHQLELDLDVLVHAQPGFADLRLVRDGAQVPYLLERPALSRSLDLTLTPANDPKRPRVSRWEIKLPRAGLPLTRLTLASSTALFQRRLSVSEKISDDRGNSHDRPLAAADWSHTPGNKLPLALALNTAPTTDTLTVETDNGDNPPLVLDTVTATHPVARLLFKTDAAPVALYYGNRQIGAPRYDLALVAGQILRAEKSVATLAAEEKLKSDGWTKTALGGGRGGVVFWAVLALVVVALLVVVAKLLPKPPAASA